MTHHPADTHVDVMLWINGGARRLRFAVYHATGRRIRSLPITVEQLL
jgi:hypothetical protein